MTKLSAVGKLKADIRAAIAKDDWDEVDRLLGVKHPKLTPISIQELARRPTAPFRVTKRKKR